MGLGCLRWLLLAFAHSCECVSVCLSVCAWLCPCVLRRPLNARQRRAAAWAAVATPPLTTPRGGPALRRVYGEDSELAAHTLLFLTVLNSTQCSRNVLVRNMRCAYFLWGPPC